MDISALKRNADAVKATLEETKQGSLVTKTGCRIQIQESFRSKKLISMGIETLIVGFFTMINPDGSYAVTTTPSMFRTKPASIKTVEIKGVSYYELTYKPGQTVFASLDLLKDNTLLYYLFEEVLARGRIPWFMSYTDLSNFFTLSPYYTGTHLVATPSIGEMIVAQIARQDSNRRLPLRQSVKKYSDVYTIPYSWIPLRNVVDGSTDTTTKISGSYTADGLDSAIVNPNTVIQPIEAILRT
ncbi:virion-associated protein [Serratia phage Moabite]|uniref:Uncharacterized protein n=3 Tax=Moabitevirus TaxID=2843422 RepID=A0A7T3NBH6_9CAUD|nr:virion structural protein [Serratia phage vB_SmaM_ 2050HW]YP_009849275.1 virion structural protein [Serratia phage Moabite]QPX76642.1 hypothetical protein [Serratia phage vB_SmaM_Yaphecito]UCR74711.1 hypothetical protein [Serratia phage BUCT660]UGO54068.1 hypothetical protein HAYMO_86 [Serratia phage vB_SmaM_Haymo]UQT03577.1 hypothetical protein KODAMA_01100 [Serratia phage vB_SmaM-Kodama]URG14281.1 virion structural protein [Pectobacterium phage vB_ParM-25]